MTRHRNSRRPVSYVEPLLAGAQTPESPFLHLGHWDDPDRPDKDLHAAQRRMNDRLLAMADLRDGQTVLDVGCGLGGSLMGLASHYPQMRLTGLELGEQQLRRAIAMAESRHAGRISFVCGDACALPFAAGRFDVVISIEAAFHFASRRRFLEEVRRVLRPGGLVALSDIIAGPRLPELQATDGPAFAVGAVVQDGVGPWSDFWGREPPYSELAREAGLRLRDQLDATSNTLPSYRLFLGDGARARHGTEQGLNPLSRALAVMEWLQARQMLQVIYAVFER